MEFPNDSTEISADSLVIRNQSRSEPLRYSWLFLVLAHSQWAHSGRSRHFSQPDAGSVLVSHSNQDFFHCCGIHRSCLLVAWSLSGSFRRSSPRVGVAAVSQEVVRDTGDTVRSDQPSLTFSVELGPFWWAVSPWSAGSPRTCDRAHLEEGVPAQLMK